MITESYAPMRCQSMIWIRPSRFETGQNADFLDFVSASNHMLNEITPSLCTISWLYRAKPPNMGNVPEIAPAKGAL
jgi:hypothetical protein